MLTALGSLRAEWVAEHRAERPGLDVLQADVDAWIAAHDAAAAEAVQEQEAAAAGDDGWTVVGSKKGRRKTTDGEGTVVGGVAPAKAERKRKAGAQGAPDFYRHQRRENQRNAVVELRLKFEEDKKRIAELRAQRKFKPL
jgi:ribosomal RNA-processing protein 7